MSRNFICYNGCPFILDASCVEYTDAILNNLISASPGDRLDAILQTIDSISLSPTTFIANSTNSIASTPGGTIGHSPEYRVRLNPSVSNLLVLTNDGLKVVLNAGGDGKVKVNAGDPKDYLEDQFATADDGVVILTVTPTTVSGKIQFQPSIDAENLLITIRDTYLEEFCEIIHDCIPHTVGGFTTTTTTTTIPPCNCYSLTNNGAPLGPTVSFDYIDCNGLPQVGGVDPQTTLNVCAQVGSLSGAGLLELAVVDNGLCEGAPECAA